MMKKLLRTLFLTAMMAMPLTSYAGYVNGDVNRDGKVTIADVTALIDYLLSNVDSYEMSLVADLNHDNSVSIADVTLLIDFLLSGNGGAVPVVITENIDVNGVTFTMVKVDAGTFMMGATAEQLDEAQPDEFPAHEVTITYDYYIAQTEVTWELWFAVMGDDASDFQGDLRSSVTNVSLFDVAIFVDKLTEETGRVFRTPTEAEWEFAARGGNLSKYYKYSGSHDVDAVAWYDVNAGAAAHSVAQKVPNELGLFDMSGNVAEWCQDWYVRYDSGSVVNPVGPESGQTNVYRGGSWSSPALMCRVSARGNLDPHKKAGDLGFRMVMNCQ